MSKKGISNISKNNKIVIITIIFLVVIIVLLIYLLNNNKEDFRQKRSKIPKIICSNKYRKNKLYRQIIKEKNGNEYAIIRTMAKGNANAVKINDVFKSKKNCDKYKKGPKKRQKNLYFNLKKQNWVMCPENEISTLNMLKNRSIECISPANQSRNDGDRVPPECLDIKVKNCSDISEECNSYTVTVPSVNDISVSAFKDCIGLKSVTLPNAVFTIKSSAFSGCQNLESINFTATEPHYWRDRNVPEFRLYSIGDYAFKGCKKLKNVVLPNNITSIGQNAFQDCESLGELVLPEPRAAKLVIGRAAFQNSGITGTLKIPTSMQQINSGTFRNTLIEELIFPWPGGVSLISGFAFADCSLLKKITIPDYIKFNRTAFSGCDNIEKVIILKTTNIGLTESSKNLNYNDLFQNGVEIEFVSEN